jgi:acetolactate synthase-1/2/3 large subunit
VQLPVIDAARIHELVSRAERPVILAGSGIRLAGGEDEFRKLVDRWGVPVVTGFNAHDLLWHEHPCNIGRQGTIGDRAGNFAVQNADLLLIVGSRLTIRQISYNWENFAPNAYKIIVDVDDAELRKPTIKADLPVHADAREFLQALNVLPAPPRRDEWLQWCQQRKERYPVVLPEYKDDSRGLNPYVFVKRLFQLLPDDTIVVTGDGTACVTTFQAAQLKRGQRLYSDGGCAPMGFDLPGAIGACIGSGRKRVICLAGDGSIQMNIQELQTMATNRLPISIFVLNNDGYLSIRLTQKNFFPDNPVGAGPESGVGIPNFAGIAAAYGLPYASTRANATLDDAIRATIEADGPTMCEVFLDPEQPFAPKTSSRRLPDGRMISAPLEDMFPFLDRDEFEANIIKGTPAGPGSSSTR